MKPQYSFKKTGETNKGWPEYGVSLRGSGQLLGYAKHRRENDWYIVVEGFEFNFRRREECAAALHIAYLLKG